VSQRLGNSNWRCNAETLVSGPPARDQRDPGLGHAEVVSEQLGDSSICLAIRRSGGGADFQAVVFNADDFIATGARLYADLDQQGFAAPLCTSSSRLGFVISSHMNNERESSIRIDSALSAMMAKIGDTSSPPIDGI